MTRNKTGILASVLILAMNLAPIGAAAAENGQGQANRGTAANAPLIGRIAVTATREQMEIADMERRIAKNDRKPRESRRTAAIMTNATGAL